jgi:hypothetical protein
LLVCVKIVGNEIHIESLVLELVLEYVQGLGESGGPPVVGSLVVVVFLSIGDICMEVMLWICFEVL